MSTFISNGIRKMTSSDLIDGSELMLIKKGTSSVYDDKVISLYDLKSYMLNGITDTTMLVNNNTKIYTLFSCIDETSSGNPMEAPSDPIGIFPNHGDYYTMPCNGILYFRVDAGATMKIENVSTIMETASVLFYITQMTNYGLMNKLFLETDQGKGLASDTITFPIAEGTRISLWIGGEKSTQYFPKEIELKVFTNATLEIETQVRRYENGVRIA